jgi:hypothetical protein
MKSAFILPTKLLRGVHRKKINEILDYLAGERLNDTPSVRFDRTTAGIFPTVRIPQSSSFGEIDTWTYFGFRLLGTSTLEIKSRAATFHSIGFSGTVEQQTVALTGTEAWVYVEIDRRAVSGGVFPVRVAASRPGSDQTFLNWTLYRFDLSGGSYTLGHVGAWDLNIDNPVAST